MSAKTCPNCGAPIKDHPENGCVLAALFTVVRDRESLSTRKLNALFASTNVDNLWADLGKIVDKLEDGDYAI